jgi:hypothetical protein
LRAIIPKHCFRPRQGSAMRPGVQSMAAAPTARKPSHEAGLRTAASDRRPWTSRQTGGHARSLFCCGACRCRSRPYPECQVPARVIACSLRHHCSG